MQNVNDSQSCCENQCAACKCKKPMIVGGVIFSLVMLILGIYLGKTYFSPSAGQNSRISVTPTSVVSTSNSTEATSGAEMANWTTYKNDLYNFELKIPQGWREAEHSSNFQNYIPLQSPDGSILQVRIEDKPEFKSLAEYLKDLDEKDKTGFEGKPSTKILSTNNTMFDGTPSIERTFDLLSAGFREIATYVYLNNKFWTFTVIPNSEDLYKTEAYKNYYQILSTFKFTKKDNLPAENLEVWKTYKSSLSFEINYPKDWVIKDDILFSYDPGDYQGQKPIPDKIVKCDFVSGNDLSAVKVISQNDVQLNNPKIVKLQVEYKNPSMTSGDTRYVFEQNSKAVSLICYFFDPIFQSTFDGIITTFKFL